MINIIGKKNWYFLFSLVILIPGMLSLIFYGLNLSIDFTGGSRMTFLSQKEIGEKAVAQLKDALEKEKIKISSTQISDKSLFVRTSPIDETQNRRILESIKKQSSQLKQESFETIGPTVGKEITWNALQSIFVASILIVIYIAWSFRKVPKPASSWRFGICAIVALLHDALFVLGVFSILGHFFNVEIDSLFVTAVLTVIGFSVHDTIVVFDRIRENLLRLPNTQFVQTVNDSILQTLVRSLNTSFTAILILLTLLIFGGESIKWFTFALLIGIVIGTYSSIFNAAPLLVSWQQWEQKRLKR